MLMLLVAQQLLLAQVVPSVIVLLFARYRDDEAWRVGLSFGALVCAVAIAAAVTVIGAAEGVQSLLAPGLHGVARSEAVLFVRWFAVAWIPLSAVGVLVGVFHAYRIFWLAPVSALLGNVVLAMAILGLGRTFGAGSLLVGVVGSALLSLCLHVGYLGLLIRRGEMSVAWSCSLRHPGVRSGVALAGPLVAGVMFAHCGALVLNRVLSTLSPGSIAVFGYAWKLGTIMTLLPASLAVVLLPQLVQQWARGPDVFREACRHALRAALFLGLPAAALFFAVREPLVRVLLQRGAFSEPATMTAVSLFGLMVFGAPASIITGYLTKMLHAAWNTRAPAWGQALGAAVLVIAAPRIARTHGALGIAGLTVCVSWFNAAVLLAVLRWRYDSVALGELGAFSLRVGAVALASAWVAHVTMGTGAWLPAPMVAVQPVVALLAGAGTFVLASVASGIPEARRCTDFVQWQGRWVRDAIRSAVRG
jgi:putative peptidoglycan lipid II flippase